jgi:beta-phosphoglucomutase-like phosphatase (HAD superfamily)
VLAIEDSPAGVAAAQAAQVAVVVVRSFYFPRAAVPGALAVGASLGSNRGWQPASNDAPDQRVQLAQLIRWHRSVAGGG